MSIDTNIFEQSKMPRYLQVAKLFRHKIETREWALDQQIPTLEQLVREYPVARSTLREALGQLEDEGLIQRRRGRGTFVSKDLTGERWFRLPVRWDDLLDTVNHLQVELISVTRKLCSLPDDHLITDVGGVPAVRYQHLRRVHSRKLQPYCLIDIFLEKSIFREDPARFKRAAVLTRLAQISWLKIATARQQLRVTVSDETTATHLGIGMGEPIAEVRRVLLDDSMGVVYYAHIRYPARMLQVDIDLFGGRADRLSEL